MKGQEEKSIRVPRGSVFWDLFCLFLYSDSVRDFESDGSLVTYADETCPLFTDKSLEVVRLKSL